MRSLVTPAAVDERASSAIGVGVVVERRHSLTKFLGGHGNSIGGVIVETQRAPLQLADEKSAGTNTRRALTNTAVKGAGRHRSM
jgi:O-acetylhomoserine/O-acetylserine sulfhydrylase-like pyridoxal-dependent enzyme